MAGEAQYINPIIQAMFETANLSQKVAQRKQESEQFKAEQALREKTAAATQKHLEGQTEYQKSLIEQEAERLKQQADLNHIHGLQLINELTARGLDIRKILQPGKPQPTGETQQAPGIVGGIPQTKPTVQVPGLGDVDPTGFQTPAGEAQRIQNLVQSQEQGKQNVLGPLEMKYKNIDAQNRLALQSNEFAQQLRMLQGQGANAERLERIRAGAQQANTNLTGQYHLKGIEIANGIDPNDPAGTNNVNENLIDGILQGQEDYKALPKARKQGIDALAASRGWILPTDQKKYAKDLDSITTIQQVLSQFRDLANNYSRDTPGGTNISKLSGGLVGGVIPGTDLSSKLDTMKGMGGTLASYFDQQNRKSDAEILREVTAAYDPKATKQQNLTKLEDLTKRLDGTVKNTFRGMPGDQVNHILSSHGITDFGGYGINTPKQGGTINIIRDANGQLVQQ